MIEMDKRVGMQMDVSKGKGIRVLRMTQVEVNGRNPGQGWPHSRQFTIRSFYYLRSNISTLNSLVLRVIIVVASCCVATRSSLTIKFDSFLRSAPEPQVDVFLTRDPCHLIVTFSKVDTYVFRARKNSFRESNQNRIDKVICNSSINLWHPKSPIKPFQLCLSSNYISTGLKKVKIKVQEGLFNVLHLRSPGNTQLGPVVASNRVFFSTAPQPSPSIIGCGGVVGIIILQYQQPILKEYLIWKRIRLICSDGRDMIRLLSQNDDPLQC